MQIEYWPIVIGAITVIVNIGIAVYNIGKNRIIYEIEEELVNTKDEKPFAKLKNKLNKAEYTILNSYERSVAPHTKTYVLGRVSAMSSRKTKKIIAKEGLFLLLLLFGITCLYLSRNFNKEMLNLISVAVKSDLTLSGWGIGYNRLESSRNFFVFLGTALIIFYMGRLFIRFIIWAIKTIREK